MAFTPPTVAQVVQDFSPVLDDVDPTKIQLGITLGMRLVDDSWLEGDYTRAIELYAAHFVVQDGSAAFTGGSTGVIQSESLGPIHVAYERFNPDAVDPTGLLNTIYGREFLMLQQLNRGGARSV